MSATQRLRRAELVESEGSAGFQHLGPEVLQLITNNLSVWDSARTLALVNRELHSLKPAVFANPVLAFAPSDVQYEPRHKKALLGYLCWLRGNWRAATYLYLDLGAALRIDSAGIPAPPGVPVEPSAGHLQALVVFSCDPAEDQELGAGQKWFARLAKQSMSTLRTLHLRSVKLDALPALPHLAHLVLEQIAFRPALLISLQHLARLETLCLSGSVVGGAVLDLKPCTNLRRVFVSKGFLKWPPWLYERPHLAWDGALPSGCRAAVEMYFDELSPVSRPWLVQLAPQLESVALACCCSLGFPDPAVCLRLPELSRVQHLTLSLQRVPLSAGGVCVSHIFGCLPSSVTSLDISYSQPLWRWSDSNSVQVPASLHALRIRYMLGDRVPKNEKHQYSFMLPGRGRLTRLCLRLGGTLTLGCLDEAAAARLQELNVQAPSVILDAHLADEVALRGRVQTGCTRKRITNGPHIFCLMQKVHIGGEPLCIKHFHWHSEWCEQPWPCTCGTCRACLGPGVFPMGGGADGWDDG